MDLPEYAFLSLRLQFTAETSPRRESLEMTSSIGASSLKETWYQRWRPSLRVFCSFCES